MDFPYKALDESGILRRFPVLRDKLPLARGGPHGVGALYSEREERSALKAASTELLNSGSAT
jgi:hypothetical protein